MELLEKYGFLVIGWFLFGLLHSLMASSVIKNKLRLSDLSYRRLYNVQSLIFVLLLLLYGSILVPSYFMEGGKVNKAVGLMLATFGYLIIKLVFKQISLSAFLGFKAEESTALITTGIYARMRHPIYTATILTMIGFLVFSPTYTNVIHAFCATTYILIGAQLEEKKLAAVYGESYKEYKKNTPFLIPKLFAAK